METIKNLACGIIGLAAVVLYIVVACMIGVLPIMFGFWMWNKIMG